MSKKELRKEMLALRDALSVVEQEEKSAQIAQRVITLEWFRNADKVFLYSEIKSEVKTEDIFMEAQKLCKKIYYPRVHGDKMEFYLVDETTKWEKGAFGIKEPKTEDARRYVPSKEDTLCMLLPGAVFDRTGNRIGYGGGYYDKYLQRLLETLPEGYVHKIALAYECQIVPEGKIEKEMHDICVDCVVTERG